VTYRDIAYDDDDFEDIGEAFTKAHPECVKKGMVGAAIAILVQQRPLIDFAVRWIDQHRTIATATAATVADDTNRTD
jgi:aminoglycoside 3-N-acetyltransferase